MNTKTFARRIGRGPFGNPTIETPGAVAIPRHTNMQVNTLSPKMAFWLGLNVARAMEGLPEADFGELQFIWSRMTGQD